MSDFGNAFCYGFASARFGALSFLNRGYYGYGLTQEAVLNSPMIFSCYADLDSPSGLSSAIPSVNYAMNRSFMGGMSGFTYPTLGFGGFGYCGGFGGFGGFGYWC